MALPAVLKNMNVFNDGDNYIGQIAEATLPKIALLLEDWRGGGMIGPVQLDMGVDKIEFEWKPGGIIKGIYQQFGEPAIDGVQMRWLGGYQADDTGQVTRVEITLRGRHAEIDPGGAKVGEAGGHTIKTAASYYRLKIDGDVVVEIDFLAMIFVVNGVDRAADLRAAIGL